MKDGRKPYHHGDLPRQLVLRALDLIATQGVAAVTMRELSQIIGVSRMAAYRHFKNKHELLCAVAEHGFREIAHRYEAIVAQDHASALDALIDLGRTYVAFALENPELYRLMFGSELIHQPRPASMQAAATQAFSMLPATVARCQAQGLVRSGSSQAIASMLWSMMHGLSSLLIDGQLQTGGNEDGMPIFLTDNLGRRQEGFGKIVDLVVEMLFHGLTPRPGEPDLN